LTLPFAPWVVLRLSRAESALKWAIAPMDPSRELGKLLLIAGIVIVGAGALLFFGAKLPFRLGRLPGDISYQGRHGSFYFPIVTCLLVSAALTLVFWVVSHFRR